MAVWKSPFHAEFKVQHDHCVLIQMLTGQRDELRCSCFFRTRPVQFDQLCEVDRRMSKTTFFHRQTHNACLSHSSIEQEFASAESSSFPTARVKKLQCLLNLDRS